MIKQVILLSAILLAAIPAIAKKAAPTTPSITINSLTVSPSTVAPGQTVTITAVMTANETLSSYPVEFSEVVPGTTAGVNDVAFVNYPANQKVTQTASYAIPASAAQGTYVVYFNAFNPSWSVPDLASGTVTFQVATPSAPPPPPPATSASTPGPSAALYAAPFYSCVRNFYVATTGSDSNAGTAASPWLTIQHADSSSRQGGDCINVAAGLYEQDVLIQHGGTAPTATGYVAYRCQTLDGCHVLAPGSGHLWGFEGGGNFVVVDGFEVDGNNALVPNGVADACFGSDGDTYGTGKSSHHLWILNNIIHDCNLAGIDFNNKEWYYILQNTVYHNSWTSGYQGSGIGLVVVQCIEAGNGLCASGSTYAGGTGTYTPSGMDLTYLPPFHIVISGNNVYDNMIAANNPVACGAHTDGNGIIMDTFLDETTLSLVFPYRSLVSYNVSYANGGRGIHVFRTSNVTVANNTVYGNGTDPCLSAYYLGDLSQAGGANNIWMNNISQSVVTAVNPACAYCGGRNVPLVAGDAAGITDENNTYTDNITYGGNNVQLFNNDVNYFSCSSNQCGTLPDFTSTSVPNFALEPSSPAIGKGETETYLPSTSVDVGACPHALTTCE
jgi:parallel beta-helix repeat protein